MVPAPSVTITSMFKAALILIALVLLVACNSNPAPPPSASQPQPAATSAPAPAAAQPAPGAGGPLQARLQELAGSNASDCGNVKAISGDELKTASDCAMQAAKAKKPFLVSYDMPGLSVGVAGNSEGKIFAAQTAEQGGKAAPINSMPCPSELRLAQSGRVTCMPAGSMGVAPGSGNPHAGQTASPHGGGMPVPPAGTPNPHAPAPSKSH